MQRKILYPENTMKWMWIITLLKRKCIVGLRSNDGKGRCYLSLDELQEFDGWEKVVNSLLEGEDVDIYVTGSNSKFMLSEISTYLS